MDPLSEKDLDKCEYYLLRFYEQKLKFFLPFDSERNLKDGNISSKAFSKNIARNVVSSIDSQVQMSINSMNFGGKEWDYMTLISNRKQPYFNFSLPVAQFDENGNFVRNYKQIEAGDRLYIWANVSRDGVAGHLSAIIITKDNVHIGFGMGLGGDAENLDDNLTNRFFKAIFNPKDALLYTPDWTFNLMLFRQLTKPGTRFVKLIAAADLTDEYVKYINEEFDKLAEEDFSLRLDGHVISADFFGNVEAKGLSRHYMLKTLKKNTKILKAYLRGIEREGAVIMEIPTKLSNEQKQKLQLIQEQLIYTDNLLNGINNYKELILKKNSIVLLFQDYVAKIRSRTYCLFSGKTKLQEGANCTSFLQKIFGGLLNCGYYNRFLGVPSDLLITNPAWCRQRADVVPVPKCSLVRPRAGYIPVSYEEEPQLAGRKREMYEEEPSTQSVYEEDTDDDEDEEDEDGPTTLRRRLFFAFNKDALDKKIKHFVESLTYDEKTLLLENDRHLKNALLH